MGRAEGENATWGRMAVVDLGGLKGGKADRLIFVRRGMVLGSGFPHEPALGSFNGHLERGMNRFEKIRPGSHAADA